MPGSQQVCPRALLVIGVTGVLAGATARSAAAQATFDAVVEIPAGTAVKYEFDACVGRMRVDRFVQMPVGYPANYGYIHGTLGGDGDALDVLLFAREPLHSGAIVAARAIGVLRMTDRGEADEKVIAVPISAVDPGYDHVRTLADLGRAQLLRIEHFFRTYKLLPPDDAGSVELRGFGDGQEAERIIAQTKQHATEQGGAAPKCRAASRGH